MLSAAQEDAIQLQVRSIGKYLARRGFTPQKSIKRANEQSATVVRAWLQGEYPGIEQRAKAEARRDRAVQALINRLTLGSALVST